MAASHPNSRVALGSTPLDADFQIYKFNEAVQTLTSDQTVQWQSMGDGSALTLQ